MALRTNSKLRSECQQYEKEREKSDQEIESLKERLKDMVLDRTFAAHHDPHRIATRPLGNFIIICLNGLYIVYHQVGNGTRSFFSLTTRSSF